MIEAIHISPISNRQSIEENGLTPSKVKLPHHLENFKEDGVCTKDGRALYTWIDCDKNEKFIRDMIFCHIFIDPRNALYYDSQDEYIDFRKLLNVNMAPWSYMIYDVYEVKTSLSHGIYYHIQTTGDNIYSTTYGMPDEYAHEDKMLCVLKRLQKKIRRVGQAQYYYDNNHHHIKILR